MFLYIKKIIVLSICISFRLFMSSTHEKYQRSVFSVFDLFGTLGGTYGLLSSACSIFVGFISNHIMLSSVFRRLYLTNATDNDQFKYTSFSKLQYNKNLVEETKDIDNYKVQTVNSRIDECKSNLEFNASIKQQSRNLDETFPVNNAFHKLQSKLNQRRKYKASCFHKILTLIPTCMWNYKGVIRK